MGHPHVRATKRAVVVGLDSHAKKLAELLNGHSARWRAQTYGGSRLETLRSLLALRSADVLVCFGGPRPSAVLSEAVRRLNIPVIIIWSGTDVSAMREDPNDLALTRQETYTHFAVAPWLVEELRSIGVEAAYVPVSAAGAGSETKPFPSDFRVITYLPQPRRDFYGAKLVYRAARALPGVTFTAIGAGGQDPGAPPNVHFVGMVRDVERYIDDSCVLLREPQHDGMSKMVLEALARGRHVVWNYEFPHAVHAKGTAETIEALRTLCDRHARGELPLNVEGREFVLHDFSRDATTELLERQFDAVASGTRVRSSAKDRRVVISGLPLFCAEVVQHARRLSPEWDVTVLRTESRSEVLTAIYALTQADLWYSIGSPVTDQWLELAARILRKPRVLHWVGSDIASLRERPWLSDRLKAPSIIHLAEVEWTAEELQALGFQPRIVPLPPRHSRGEVPPLPSRFTIMLYVPRIRSHFYGSKAFQDLMRRLASEPVRYLIVGGGSLNVPEGVDARNLGWTERLASDYARTTLLIRFTPRDGLSLMVLEALSYGRHVLWTHEFPHVGVVHSVDAMEREVRRLLEQHEAGTLEPQTDAAAMVRGVFAPDICIEAIAQTWRDAVERRRSAPRLAVETT